MKLNFILLNHTLDLTFYSSDVHNLYITLFMLLCNYLQMTLKFMNEFIFQCLNYDDLFLV